MISEEALKQSFQKVKEDMEGVKDELAFALRRIAKIEEAMNKKIMGDIVANARKSKDSRKKKK